ncbi:hypothetical protein DFH11DRAFT_1687053 [Phellopilus nigrolimitatus]|nr:hypothetical protein DFH11DRAFT_1687053 [Phellopilus nigrolimitatus]
MSASSHPNFPHGPLVTEGDVHDLQDDSDLTIVELGSGNGYVGFNLARKLSEQRNKSNLLGLTELPDVCTLLHDTLRNEKEHGDGGPRYLSYLVCSDLPRYGPVQIYFPHLLALLLRSLLQFTSPPLARSDSPPEVRISYRVRSLTKKTAFWAAFGLWFTFAPVLARSRVQRMVTEAEAGFVFTAFRRPESCDWTVPSEDEELMTGVRVGGTETTKTDDTFETLLLMQLGESGDIHS